MRSPTPPAVLALRGPRGDSCKGALLHQKTLRGLLGDFCAGWPPALSMLVAALTLPLHGRQTARRKLESVTQLREC